MINAKLGIAARVCRTPVAYALCNLTVAKSNKVGLVFRTLLAAR